MTELKSFNATFYDLNRGFCWRLYNRMRERRALRSGSHHAALCPSTLSLTVTGAS
ncbi:hypothetical protein CKA32_004840 [Geitlerinema sp. FC II]|nr:hypothetical protein CKA32_004840 [Geitlerinema sp. FC II]